MLNQLSPENIMSHTHHPLGTLIDETTKVNDACKHQIITVCLSDGTLMPGITWSDDITNGERMRGAISAIDSLIEKQGYVPQFSVKIIVNYTSLYRFSDIYRHYNIDWYQDCIVFKLKSRCLTSKL